MAANDMNAAERTYAGFINLLKFSVPAICALALLVLVLIAS